MNNYTISLPSNTTSYYEILPLLNMEDQSQIILDFSLITERIVPINIQIDWGDNLIENFDKNNVTPEEINIFKFSPLLLKSYKHEYIPSETSLYKCLSAQVIINYCNGDVTWFVIPLKIRTYDYFESIGDVKLLNTNILPIDGNIKEHQLLTSKDGYTIELLN
jgi:hypothetical protein